MDGDKLRPFIQTPILRILLAGFAALIVLVAVLTSISLNRLARFSRTTEELQQRYLYNRGLADKLNGLVLEMENDSKVRAAYLATQLNIPDTVGRRIAVQKKQIGEVVGELKGTRLAATESWAALERQLQEYIATAESPETYALDGAAEFRKLKESQTAFITAIETENQKIIEEGERLLSQSRRDITLATAIILLLCGAIAVATVVEISRRLQELDRSNRANTRAREFTRNILNSMVEALFTLNSEGVITSANLALNQIVGLSKAKVLGAKYTEIFQANPKLISLLDEALADSRRRKSYAGRLELGLEGGRFDAYVSPLISSGQKEGLIVTLINVTEMERAQDELRRQAALAVIGQMTAQVAHEIKNPIGGIKLNLSYLKRKFKDNEEALEVTGDLEAQVERLHQTALEINQFARPRELQLRPVNLNELVDEQLSLIGDQIQAKRLEIVRHYQADLPNGQFDQAEVSKVFINLLGNAAEACTDQDRIEVSTRLTASALVEVQIKDTGSGMDQRTLDRLFEPFYTTKKQGTGLGMATAKKIIEQHRGSIEVESAVGQGTTIRVYLPVESGRLEKAAAVPEHAHSR